MAGPEVDQRDLGWAAERSERCILVPLPAPADAARQWLAHPDGRAAVVAAQPLPGRARLASSGLGLREIGDRAFDLVWTMRSIWPASRCRIEAGPGAWSSTSTKMTRRRSWRSPICTTAAANSQPRPPRGGSGRLRTTVAHAARWFDQIVTATDQGLRARRQHSSAVTTVPNAVKVRIASRRRSHGHGPPRSCSWAT